MTTFLHFAVWMTMLDDHLTLASTSTWTVYRSLLSRQTSEGIDPFCKSIERFYGADR